MRYFVRFCWVTIVLVSIPAKAEVLLNESFSSPAAIKDWTVSRDSDPGDVRFETGTGHGNPGCLSVNSTGKKNVILRHHRRIEVKPDTTYLLEGFALTRLDRHACPGGGIYLQMAWHDASDKIIGRSRTGITFRNDPTYGTSDFSGWSRIAEDWMHHAHLPPDGAVYAYLEIVGQAPVCPFVVDDIQVSEVSCGQPQTWFGRPLVCLNGKWQMMYRPWQATEKDVPKPEEKWQSYWVPGYTPLFRDGQAMWAKRTFTLPSGFDSPRITLHFERIHSWCAVYLNGKRIGEHLSNDLPFDLDITDTVRREGSNELLVFVRNWLATYNPPIDPKLNFERARECALAHPENRLTHSSHWDWNALGIPLDVVLLGSGKSYVENVAVRSRLNPTALTVVGEVTARTGDNLIARCEVVDAGQVVLKMPPVKVEQGKFQVQCKFPSGKLWWPNDPKLYVLRTCLTDSKGRVIDEHRERFGIRTIATQGDIMIFNGVKMRFRNSSNWFPTYRRYDNYNREEMVKCFTWMKSINESSHRAHCSGHPRLVFQAADEAGMLMIIEPAGPADNMPEHVDYYKTFYREWVKWTRNNPSIFMRSIMNEFFSSARDKKYEAPIRELVNIVRQEQPEVPITFESDLDVYGLSDVLGLHYPDCYAFQTEWPNSLYWVGTTKYVNTPAYVNHKFNWDRQKPLHIGEFGWMNWFTPDLDATLLGDAAYHERWDNLRLPHDLARAFGWTHMIEAYRNQGITGMGAWTLYEPGDLGESNPLIKVVKQSYAPLVAFPREYSASGWGGDTVNRRIVLHNDLFASAKIQLHWEYQIAPDWTLPSPLGSTAYAEAGAWRSFTLQEDGDDNKLSWKTICENESDHTLSPTEIKETKIQVRLPEVKVRQHGRIRIDIKQEGKIVWTGYRGLDVWPKLKATKTTGPICVYDPHGQTIKELKRLNVSFEAVTKPVSAIRHRNGILIIGRDALNDDVLKIKAQLNSWISGGGRVICLEQKNWKNWLTVDIEKTCEGPYTIAHIRSPGHPLLADFSPSDFRFWTPDHVMARNIFPKPMKGQARSLIDIGTENGLDHAALLEIPQGEGLVLLCALTLIDRVAQEPVAAAALQRMITYADQYQVRQSNCAMVQTDDSNIKKIFGDLKLNIREVSVAQFTAAENTVLIVTHPTGGWSKTAQEISALRKAVSEGMTLYVHDLDDEGFKCMNDLLHDKLRWIVKDKVTVPMHVVKNTSVTWGISSQHLYWFGPSVAWTQIKQLLPAQSRGVQVTGIDHEVLVNDGLLIRIPIGKGSVIIDQVPWEKSQGNDKLASQYINMLLMNLGVRTTSLPQK